MTIPCYILQLEGEHDTSMWNTDRFRKKGYYGISRDNIVILPQYTFLPHSYFKAFGKRILLIFIRDFLLCCLKKDVYLFDDWAAKHTLENNFHYGNHYKDVSYYIADIQKMSLLGSLNVYCTCLLNATL